MGRRLAARPRARRGLRRLRAHRVGRLPDPVAGRPSPPGARGGEGHVLDQDPGPGHAWARLAALPHRQRARDRGRGGPPDRRVPPADADPRVVAPLRRGHALRSRGHPRRSSSPDDFDGAFAELPLGIARTVPRVHAHHVRADGRARRHQDQRHPRPRRPRGRHPHAAGPERRRRHCSAARGPRRPRRPRRDRVERRPGHRRRRSTRRCGTRSHAPARACARDPRWCRRSWSVAPTTGSSGAPVPWATASGCSRSACPTRTSPPCSTATTSGSTRSRSRCRRSCGRRSRATSSGDGTASGGGAQEQHPVDGEDTGPGPHQVQHRHQQGRTHPQVEAPAVDTSGGGDRRRPGSRRGRRPPGG